MDDIKDRQHNLLFGIRRSIRYHNRRCKFFDGFNLFVNAVNILFGSAVVVSVLSSMNKTLSLSIALSVTAFTTLNLLFNTSIKARLHSDLARRFIELEKKLVVAGEDIKTEDLNKFIAERLDIEADEPPVLRVLNCICHNELSRAMGYSKEHFVSIKFYQRWASQFIDINEHSISS